MTDPIQRKTATQTSHFEGAPPLKSTKIAEGAKKINDFIRLKYPPIDPATSSKTFKYALERLKGRKLTLGRGEFENANMIKPSDLHISSG